MVHSKFPFIYLLIKFNNETRKKVLHYNSNFNKKVLYVASFKVCGGLWFIVTPFIHLPEKLNIKTLKNVFHHFLNLTQRGVRGQCEIYGPHNQSSAIHLLTNPNIKIANSSSSFLQPRTTFGFI